MRVLISIVCSIIILIGFNGVQESFAEYKIWYLGEGLKQGDFFSYKICNSFIKNCSDFQMDFWIEGKANWWSEPVWDTMVVTFDPEKLGSGKMYLGRIVPKVFPITNAYNRHLHDFGLSVVWLESFVNEKDGKPITDPMTSWNLNEIGQTWGNIQGKEGQISVGPTGHKTISISAGTFETTVVSWQNNGKTSKIWIVDDVPFPIKGEMFRFLEKYIIKYEFELLNYAQNVTENPFSESYGREYNSELSPFYQNDFQSYQVKHGYDIDYTITGDNKVTEVKRDHVFDFVKFTLRAPNDGILLISFPHGLIGKGYSQNCYQDDFSILVNDVEISDYDELFTEQHRRLSIPFSANDSEIKLILSKTSKSLSTYQECTREISLEHLEDQEYDIYIFNEGHSDFFIPYKMTSGIIKEMNFDVSYLTYQTPDGPERIIQSNSGKITLDADSSGFLRIIIPRHLADITHLDCGDDEVRFTLGGDFNKIIAFQNIASNFYSRTFQLEYLQGVTEIFIETGSSIPSVSSTYSCPFHDSNSFYYSMISPKKQLDSRISSNDIKCDEGLRLIFKATDNSPACVKSTSVEKLIDRGWANHNF